jgi:hypothetical protein
MRPNLSDIAHTPADHAANRQQCNAKKHQQFDV